jgi:hypothetical protein
MKGQPGSPFEHPKISERVGRPGQVALTETD